MGRYAVHGRAQAARVISGVLELTTNAHAHIYRFPPVRRIALDWPGCSTLSVQTRNCLKPVVAETSLRHRASGRPGPLDFFDGHAAFDHGAFEVVLGDHLPDLVPQPPTMPRSVWKRRQ